MAHSLEGTEDPPFMAKTKTQKMAAKSIRAPADINMNGSPFVLATKPQRRSERFIPTPNEPVKSDTTIARFVSEDRSTIRAIIAGYDIP